MFILIPLIIIFLALSYIYVNKDIGLISEISIYIFSIFIVFVSLYIAKVIKKDLKKQKQNNINIQINQLKQKLGSTTDERRIQGLKNEIDMLSKLII